MADDYAPALVPDEDEDERRSLYPPVTPLLGDAYSDMQPMAMSSPAPAPSPAGYAPVAPMSGAADLEAHGKLTGYHPAAPERSAAERNLQNVTSQPIAEPKEYHGFKKVLDVLGRAYAPGVEQSIRYAPVIRQQQELKQAENAVAAEQKPEEERAKTSELQSRGEFEQAHADAVRNPQSKQGLTPEETTIHDLMTGENGQPRVNPETGKPYSYLEAYSKVKQAAQDVKPDKDRKTEKVTRVIGGVPHEVLIDAQTGEDIKDEGQTKVPGESSADKRTAAESVQVERESRQNIRKAEGKYRDTQKSVGQLMSSLDAAKDGNGLLTSFVPTMEVLGINASNGVHRISPAEAHAATLPGGWAERFNAWFDKASSGKLSPQLVTEGKSLAKILQQSAYKEYKATYDDENGIVSGYGGKDFGKRVPMIQDEGGAGVETHSSGIQIERDASGRIIGVR